MLAANKRAAIRSLLLVFLAGVSAAVILALGMLYFYNPSGAYLAKNLIVAPENLHFLNFKYKDPATGISSDMFLEKIEFAYYDAHDRKWKSASLDLGKYAELYALIQGDESLSEGDVPRAALFEQQPPYALALLIKNRASSGPSVQHFLDVQFAPQSDYYRILLRTTGKEQWIYFYHPVEEGAFSQKIYQLFAGV